MSTKTNNNIGNNGVGFVGLLTVVFVTLKLLDKIDWSWWWVLSPIWLSTLIFIMIFFIGFIIFIIYKVLKRSKK